MELGGIITLVYIVFVFGYGFISSRRKVLPSASSSLFISTASLCAAFIGGGFSLGNAAEGFQEGFKSAVLLFGFSVGQLAAALFLAPRFSGFSKAATVGDIIKEGFGEHSKKLTGLLSIVFCIGVLGAQISAFGSVASAVFGVNRATASLIGFTGITLFAAFGGIRASQKSDSVQVSVLFLGILLCLLFTFFYAKDAFYNLRDEAPRFISAGEFVFPFLCFMTGELLCPPSVRRILLSKNASDARRSIAISGAVSVPFFFLTALIGILARRLGTTADASLAMPSLISFALPFPLSPIILGAMLCVYLSSGCAFLLSCADALFFDVLGRSLDSEKGQNPVLFRFFCLLCGAAALILSLAFDGVLSILLLAYCFWCPALLIPLILSICNKRYSDRVFFSSVGTAAFVIILWRALGSPFGIPPMISGLFASALFFIIYKRGNRK